MRRVLFRVLYSITTLVVVAGFLPGLPSAYAASGSSFTANRIVDDATFFNSTAMGTGQNAVTNIQNFLNAEVPTCDTYGTQSYNGTTRAAYSESKGYNPPFTCLKDYHQDTPSKSAESGLCNGYNGGSNQSSAQMIYDISQTCGVNPQVLLVLLQKEQALVTDDWPWPIEYQEATGYGCPDTAACDPSYAGFFNQVYSAARQFRVYANNPNSFSYAVGRNSYVAYNPNSSCSGNSQFLFDKSTAALYNYTPYQPNQAALSNLYGNGDSCSSYGNRNFWRLFNDWFGPTTSDSSANLIDFIRLNHYSGRVESAGYSSISSYTYLSRYGLSGYPTVTPDGSVAPLIRPNGDLSFVRLNHSSGHVEIVTYSAASGFSALSSYNLSSYPAVSPDGSVIPVFQPNGDLSFIRLNHYSGRVEVVTYSASSQFTQMSGYSLTAYPAVSPDGSVIPVFQPNGDLSFIRLNHYSGRVEVVTYSASSNYQIISSHYLSSYPAVSPDGSVKPIMQPNGDLSFVRLNYYAGHVEVVTYSASSGYALMTEHDFSSYPSVSPDGSVVPLLAR